MADRAYPNGVRMQRRINPQAQLMNALWFCARNHARAQMKEQGIRVQEIEPRQLHLAAEALLKQHWQRFASEAEAMLARRSKKSRSSNSCANARTGNNGQPSSQR